MEGLSDHPVEPGGFAGRGTVLTGRRVVLWRHGRTEWNASGRFQGQLDVPLDEVGIAQAQRAAALLAHLQPAAIVSSDLARAAATAGALSEVSGLPITTDPRLRETYAGAFQGLDRTELASRFGAELAAWSASAMARPGGDGETRIEVADRTVAAIRDHLQRVGDGGTLVVATHGGSARVAICRLIGLPPEHWGALGVLSNCAWSVLLESDEGFRLIEYNAGSLPEPPLADDR